MSDIQKLAATVDTAKTGLPDLKMLRDIFDAVPDRVLQFYDLAETNAKVQTMDTDPSKAAWSAILESIKNIAEAGEKAHSSASAGAKAGQTLAQVRERCKRPCGPCRYMPCKPWRRSSCLPVERQKKRIWPSDC